MSTRTVTDAIFRALMRGVGFKPESAARTGTDPARLGVTDAEIEALNDGLDEKFGRTDISRLDRWDGVR